MRATAFALALFLAADAFAQSEPTFEVASIKITPRANFGYTSFSPYGSNQYKATNATLDFLVQIAYGVPFYQIENREKLGTEHYDLSAKAEDGIGLSVEKLQPRLRSLIEDRFKLKTHREMKTTDGYALVIAKGGPKLQRAGNNASENGMIFPGGLRLMNSSMTAFASSIRSVAGRVVVDKTGVEGNYDFDFHYAREGDTDSTLPSFFTALQETYGLRLEPEKVTTEILVIDQVDRIPSEN